MEDKNAKIIELAEEIIKNIEFNEITLTNIVLKCIRLARLSNNSDAVQLFQYDLIGYPKDKNNQYIEQNAWELAKMANRRYREGSNEKIQEYMFPETISELDAGLFASKEQMKVSYDVSYTIKSSNPNQFVQTPANNSIERLTLKNIIIDNTKKIDKLKMVYYNFATGILHYYKFTNIIEGVFNNTKLFIEKYLVKNLPETLKKFNAISDDLKSENSEHWASAVHTCRRVLKDVADLLYPANNKIIVLNKEESIKLDDDHYIFRLKEYIKEKSKSKKFTEIVGSHLEFISDRINAIYDSSNKGTHYKFDTVDEAERYVIYTYMLLGDIFKLSESS